MLRAIFQIFTLIYCGDFAGMWLAVHYLWGWAEISQLNKWLCSVTINFWCSYSRPPVFCVTRFIQIKIKKDESQARMRPKLVGRLIGMIVEDNKFCLCCLLAYKCHWLMQCWCYKVFSSSCQPSLPGEWLAGSGSISISDLLAFLFLTLSCSPCGSMSLTFCEVQLVC